MQQYGQDCISISFLYSVHFLMLCQQATYPKESRTSGHTTHTFSFRSYKHHAGGLQPGSHVISDALKRDLLPNPAKKSVKYV